MHPALIVIFITLGVLLFIWLVLSRIIRKIHPTPISHRLATILDNPVRRLVFSPAKLLDKVGIAAGMSVLELGPGPGFFTVESAQRVYSSEGLGKLYCLDIQPAMIDRVKKKIFKKALENVELMVGNACHTKMAASTWHIWSPSSVRCLIKLVRCRSYIVWFGPMGCYQFQNTSQTPIIP